MSILRVASNHPFEEDVKSNFQEPNSDSLFPPRKLFAVVHFVIPAYGAASRIRWFNRLLESAVKRIFFAISSSRIKYIGNVFVCLLINSFFFSKVKTVF